MKQVSGLDIPLRCLEPEPKRHCFSTAELEECVYGEDVAHSESNSLNTQLYGDSSLLHTYEWPIHPHPNSFPVESSAEVLPGILQELQEPQLMQELRLKLHAHREDMSSGSTEYLVLGHRQFLLEARVEAKLQGADSQLQPAQQLTLAVRLVFSDDGTDVDNGQGPPLVGSTVQPLVNGCATFRLKIAVFSYHYNRRAFSLAVRSLTGEQQQVRSLTGEQQQLALAALSPPIRAVSKLPSEPKLAEGKQSGVLHTIAVDDSTSPAAGPIPAVSGRYAGGTTDAGGNVEVHEQPSGAFTGCSHATGITRSRSVSGSSSMGSANEQADCERYAAASGGHGPSLNEFGHSVGVKIGCSSVQGAALFEELQAMRIAIASDAAERARWRQKHTELLAIHGQQLAMLVQQQQQIMRAVSDLRGSCHVPESA
eukprot:CAMPEP_0119344436 /NCGR_PEP_ID=MMETSP1333-20130426/106971_1 /TAXON_ID=418940 /ORGANISM="Scyphosphaera apsteinii, Strain RCC1455" /LENGTH=424 /DNA_ID=CAMNT_0007356875 /DNA_START=6 /DNA_END=1280 /DNA_ORIENTATION=-